jgi:hypothetical protein
MPAAPQVSGKSAVRNEIVFKTQGMRYSAIVGNWLLSRTCRLNVSLSHDGAHLRPELRYQTDKFTMRSVRRIHPAKDCHKLRFVLRRLKCQIQIIGAAASQFLSVFDIRMALIAAFLRKYLEGCFNVVSPGRGKAPRL